jgi:hypothetical protein
MRSWKHGAGQWCCPRTRHSRTRASAPTRHTHLLHAARCAAAGCERLEPLALQVLHGCLCRESSAAHSAAVAPRPAAHDHQRGTRRSSRRRAMASNTHNHQREHADAPLRTSLSRCFTRSALLSTTRCRLLATSAASLGLADDSGTCGVVCVRAAQRTGASLRWNERLLLPRCCGYVCSIKHSPVRP